MKFKVEFLNSKTGFMDSKIVATLATATSSSWVLSILLFTSDVHPNVQSISAMIYEVSSHFTYNNLNLISCLTKEKTVEGFPGC